MILVVLFAAVVCALIVIAVISFKIAVFLVGILLVVLAIALWLAPLAAASVLLTRFWQPSATTPRAIELRQYRLVTVISASLGFVVFDVIWATHSLHWSHAPILAFLVLGLMTAGVLALLQDRVEPWVENPVPAASE